MRALSDSAFFFIRSIYILISSRYQLYPFSATTHCPSGSMDAHSQKREEKLYKKRKVPLQRLIFCSSSANTTKTTPEVKLLQKRRLQEGPIIYHRFSPWKKSMLTKIMPSTRPLSGTTN
jgi:hypothetical protein